VGAGEDVSRRARAAVGDRHSSEGFEVRAWVARPETPGARLRALPIPPDVAAKLRGRAV